MTGQKHIIWSSDPDYEDWRGDLEEQYPELSEQERMELMLGHADVRTTLQVYVHSSLEHKMRVIQSICFLAPALAAEFAPSPSPSVFPETLQYQQLLAALSQMG